MCSCQAVHHDIVAILQGNIYERVQRLEEFEHALSATHVGHAQVLRDAISQVNEARIPLVIILAGAALTVDYVEDVHLFEYGTVGGWLLSTNEQLGASLRVHEDHARHVEVRHAIGTASLALQVSLRYQLLALLVIVVDLATALL